MTRLRTSVLTAFGYSHKPNHRAFFNRETANAIHPSESCSIMNPDHNTCTSKNEDEIQSTTHQLKQDDYISIGTDNAKNPSHLHRFQFGSLEKTTGASRGTGEVSQPIDSLLLMQFQDFIGVSSNNWQCEDENSFYLTFCDSITFLHDEDCKESGKDETDEIEDEDSICDSIRVTVQRRLKQSTISSSDNEYSE